MKIKENRRFILTAVVVVMVFLLSLPVQVLAGRVVIYNNDFPNCAHTWCYTKLEVDLTIWTWGQPKQIPTIAVHEGRNKTYDDVVGSVGKIVARAFTCQDLSRPDYPCPPHQACAWTVTCTSWRLTNEVVYVPTGTFLPHRVFTVDNKPGGKIDIKE